MVAICVFALQLTGTLSSFLPDGWGGWVGGVGWMDGPTDKQWMAGWMVGWLGDYVCVKQVPDVQACILSQPTLYE